MVYEINTFHGQWQVIYCMNTRAGATAKCLWTLTLNPGTPNAVPPQQNSTTGIVVVQHSYGR